MELDFNYTGNWPECMSADAGHGITVKIMYEEDQQICDPRDMTNLGVMFCDYRGYNLGDNPGDSDYDPRERTITCQRCDGSGWCTWEALTDEEMTKLLEAGISADEDGEIACPSCEGSGEIEVGMVQWLKQEFDSRVILPLFIYDHSGLTMSAGENMGSIDPRGRNPFDTAAWDTSMVGFIFDTKGTREECGCEDFSDEKIEEGLRAEVESYDMYLRGECFYYVIEDEDGNELDSCAGFLGDEYVREEAAMAAKSYVEDAKAVEHRNELAARCWRE